jgi:hypothetical protein
VTLVVAAPAFGGVSALAVTVKSTPDPLPGSSFQGADGNQAIPSPNPDRVTDWQGLQADGRVHHTVDPDQPDGIFAGGSKELEPGGWGLTTQNNGASPKGSNIADLYSAFDPPPPAGGDAFLYLAFVREATSGSQSLSLELNQDATLWRNSSGTRIPCRKTGDILISYLEHGNSGTVEVDRWVTDTADAATGCAKTGQLDSTPGLTPDVDLEASWNDAAITNYLPGFFGLGSDTIGALQFGEAAIDVSAWLASLGKPCGVIASAWAHSRASDELDSDMKDYVSPSTLRLTKACSDLSSSASGVVAGNAPGQGSLRRNGKLTTSLSIWDTATLSGADDPAGTITFKLFGPNDASCARAPAFTSTATVAGDGSYRSGAFTPTAAGSYRWVVDYSGDQNSRAAGPTACGEGAETVVISKADPTLTSSASGPYIAGAGGRVGSARMHTGRAAQPMYDTAVLRGGVAPTGTITFTLYGPGDRGCSGPAVRTSTRTVRGNGPYISAPYTAVTAGSYRWVASYSGDPHNNRAGPTTCGDPNETIVIVPARPSLATLASPRALSGAPITDTAVLRQGANPTGSVTFTLYGPNDANCAGGAIFSSTRNVDGDGIYVSDPVTPLADGSYRWRARYSGDADNARAVTACGDLGERVIVTPEINPTSISLTTSPSRRALAGSLIHDVAHLSGTANATGSITFRLYGPADNGCLRNFVLVSTVPVSGDGAYRSASVSPVVSGTYQWVVSYSGDANNAAAETTCGSEAAAVSRADPAFTTVAPSAVPVGGELTDTARLSGANPRGRVTFRLYGPNDRGCTRPPAFTVRQTVVGDGTYTSPAFAPVQAGVYRWIATYSGSVSNNRVTPACGDRGERAVVVRRRPALTTSASPLAFLRKGARGVAPGQPMFDSARLSGFAPTGSIMFALFGPDDQSCSGRPIFTSATAVHGSGIYNSARFAPAAPGSYRWRATYSGDSENGPAGTGCGDATERTQLTGDADPVLTTSASPAITLGGAIHDVAHLSGGANPTGAITFRLYSPANTGCTGPALFTSTVTVAGNNDYSSASFVPTTAGAYRWVAGYSGDRANRAVGPTACDDPAEAAVVRPPNITPVVPSFATTAGAQPAGGTTVHDTAHLAGGSDPGGTITFALFGPSGQACSGPPAFTATVAVTGNGDYHSPTFAVPGPGTYRWVATYSGDAMNAAAGPTACGDPAETVTVSATPTPSPAPGPNVPTPPKPPPKPKPTQPGPPPPPPPPRVTG